jgi:hypothetical protein
MEHRLDTSRSPAGPFGPFRPDVDRVERVAGFRALAMGAAVYCGSHHELVGELRKAETDEAAAAHALELLDRLPSLTRRRLISTFAVVMRPRPKRAT